MTELYIDRQLVVLPRNLSIPVIEENPFFTKNGTYTLDVTLSLEEAENAKIYMHINRLNTIDRLGLERSALLLVDNEVVLNGTEIITEISDVSVTIQLVSGNSELNFLIGGEKRLRDLNLGEAERYTASQWSDVYYRIWQDLQLSYPDRDWQLLPYYTNEGDIQRNEDTSLYVGNNYTLYNPPEGNPLHDRYISQYNPLFSRQVPQPYLCFIIKEVLKDLGYTLSFSSMAEHPILKNLYIVHGIQTMEYAKMLPNWTVSDFLSKIELQFDCHFFINEYDRTVQLLFSYQSEERFSKSNITVLDPYTVEINTDNKIVLSGSNIAYSLDNEKYYKYMSLDASIRKDIEHENITMSFDDFMLYISQNPESVKKNTLYKIQNDEFIIFDTGSGLTLKKADSFKPYIGHTDSEEADHEFDIIPASMVYAYLNTRYPPVGQTVPDERHWVQLPVADSFNPLFAYGVIPSPEKDPDIDIQSIIEGEGNTSSTITPNKMRLAIYDGVKKLDNRGNATIGVYYPITYTESLAEYVQEYRKTRFFTDLDVNPFRLEWLKNNIYDNSSNLDTTKTYKLTFTDPGKIDVMSKFIANNKAFRCAKIERTVTIDGFAETVKGDFYPYNN